MPRFTPLLKGISLGLLLVGSGIANAQDSASDSTAHAQLPLEELRIFTDVFNQIRVAYVDEVDDKTLLKNAVKGMLSGLDPHSAYLDASTFDDLKESTSGEFGGLGLEVGMENGYIKVISPIDDTPASEAGLESGDLIIQLGDKAVRDISLEEAVKLMRGDKGSKVTLTIVREGQPQPFDLTLTRDIIKVTAVRSKMLEPGYGYLRIAQFQGETGENSYDEVKKLIKQNKAPLKGLVIDLRNNPGGVLQASVKVVDNFVDQGLIVYTKGRLKNSDARYSATKGDILEGAPIVVLINGGSASASEIVSGALQDHGRAVIMGTDSFGKGSVQTVVPLNEDTAIKLTTALYYTPKGRSIQAQGISPDIEVKRAKIETFESARRLTEADLSGHLDNGNGGDENNGRDRAARDSSSLVKDDNQLYEALNLLKGVNILHTQRG
ncbi:carboxyl-terminal processing protease [Sinobacterium caligoides]|uniref:Carboxyl-terminal processing protease n=1 Tax=Sinobacterium caligoides TaxID=933926 RepID=A0A3N2DGG1_9GAMM|nr:S41 family peptidase [Sinobacterium caligoides]ROR98877.1 carboxyl-terminal processing protease [Sinobacterium caligoides]